MNVIEKDRIAVKEGLFRIAAETEQYDFPFLANVDKRKTLIQKRKREIDERMLGVLAMYHVDTPESFLSEEVWKNSREEAMAKFSNVSEERIMNGFYFQELMHIYVNNNIGLIDESWYSEINSARNLDE